mmetsp:Transcript_60071/g.95368  ORF Transcript_60071/g.95368 Transcript_60071/m.95368 type:complete len:201 (+) Transcript_60071:1737-2339(+)
MQSEPPGVSCMEDKEVPSNAMKKALMEASNSEMKSKSSKENTSSLMGCCFLSTHINRQMSFSTSSCGGGEGTRTDNRCNPKNRAPSKSDASSTPIRPSSAWPHREQSKASFISRRKCGDNTMAHEKTSYKFTTRPAGSVAIRSKTTRAASSRSFLTTCSFHHAWSALAWLWLLGGATFSIREMIAIPSASHCRLLHAKNN